ncbi:MAG: hypothetical protein KDB57_08635 [Solirubrobacterales bacterium]|nr:hypothetical protein [Solirubrobacterales bacterium]
MKRGASSTRGQSTVEWVGLLTLMAVLMATLTYAGVRVPAVSLAHSISRSLLCAASLSGSCAGEGSLEAAYGPELAELVRAGTPTLMYGSDMLGLPVDFRTCRSPYCAESPGSGRVGESTAGEPVTLFTRVIRKSGAAYVQYWAYYPESASLRGVPVLEEKGYHPHDWESIQIRVGPDGDVSQRASSHSGYNHGRSVANWGSDMGWGVLTDAAEVAGLREPGGWGEVTGRYLIAGGSHAGNVDGELGTDEYPAWTPAGSVRLVPLETVKGGPLARAARFEPVTPPWEKQVWRDPESEGTG